MTFLTIVGVTEILCGFRLVLEGKTGKETPESSRLEFLEKFSASNFALSDAEDNTSGPLNRGGIADLPLLRTLCLQIFANVCKYLQTQCLQISLWYLQCYFSLQN